ncbi:MAG: hypothetical protein ACWGO1_11740, partial [Anaerolineales bacterium]
SLSINDPRLVGRALREDLPNPKSGKVIGKANDRLTAKMVETIRKAGVEQVQIVPFVSDEMVYLSADVEDRFVIAQANT